MTHPQKHCVLIVDDHCIVATMLQRILNDIHTVGVAAIANSGQRALAMAADVHYDLCLIDLELPDISGFELIRLLRQEDEHVKIIVCTMHTELWIVTEVVRAHVEGMINKDAEIEEYRRAITAVLEGRTYCGERFVEVMSQGQGGGGLLSRSEVTVLRLILNGLTTKEIAARLFRSVNTIDTHRRHIMQKLGAKNIVEIVNKAHALGYDFTS